MGLLGVCHQIFHRRVDGLRQSLVAPRDWLHVGAHQAHTEDVHLLSRHVPPAHVHRRVHVKQGADHRRRGAVLAGPCLGDEAVLAGPLRQQGLPERVVEFVGAAVEQVLVFEVDVRVVALAQGFGVEDRCRPAAEVL